MTYVAINVLTVPDGAGETLEQRFAARKGSVDTAPGFLSFELLRPLTASQSFKHGHATAAGREAVQPPAATGSTIWSFDVAQESWAAHAAD